MHKNNFFISFGVWITILPFFGIPGAWKDFLMSLSGIFLVLVFLGPTILKKLQTKSKTSKNKNNKTISEDISPMIDDVLNSSSQSDGQIKTEKEVL
jgi:hypothetical protein